MDSDGSQHNRRADRSCVQLPGRIGGRRYALDWRILAGVAAGVIALLLRRGFLVVFLVAIGVTALLRLIT